MDKLTVEKTNPSSTNDNASLNGAYRSGNKLYNLPQGEQIKIFRLNGTMYYEGKIQASEMEIPAGELFIIKLQSKDNIRIIR
jgi:hypothetical protein